MTQRIREQINAVYTAFNEVLAASGVQFDLVVVFGSYARGYPRETSDLDIYLVTDNLPAERVQTDQPGEVGLSWRDDLPDPDITAVTPRLFVKKHYAAEGEEFLQTVLDDGTYVQGVPRDIRHKVGYDPIADEWE